MSSTFSQTHVLMFPFPSSGHIIPMLDLTHQLLNRGLTITVLLTPKNLSLLDPLLSTHPLSLHSLVLSPPNDDPSKLASLLPQKRLIGMMRGLRELRTPIIEWFQSHPTPPTAIVSDFFLGWTYDLASEIGVRRITFSPSGAFATSVSGYLWRNLPKRSDSDGDDFLISFEGIPNSPVFPWWQLSHVYRNFQEGDPDWEFLRNGMLANSTSWGIVFNSFTELERAYIEHVKKEAGHDRVWAVGPLLPSSDDDSAGITTQRGGSSSVAAHEVLTWLDQRSDGSVVYICFGSRAELTRNEMEALAAGLESSGVHFVWCVGATKGGHVEVDINEILNRAVNTNRGFVIRGWAPQVTILRHRAVGAFVTHCGWNSVLEGLSTGMVMLTWPTGADQFANAMLLVDQLGVGVRVGDGSEKCPNPDELSRILAESINPSRPEKLRAMELRDAAMRAVKGGSSELALDDLVKRLSELKSPDLPKPRQS